MKKFFVTSYHKHNFNFYFNVKKQKILKWLENTTTTIQQNFLTLMLILLYAKVWHSQDLIKKKKKKKKKKTVKRLENTTATTFWSSLFWNFPAVGIDAKTVCRLKITLSFPLLKTQKQNMFENCFTIPNR